MRIRNKEKVKEYNHNYYIKNKERLDALHKEWAKNHRKEETQRILKCKSKRVEKLREQGIANAWNVVTNGAKPKYEIKHYEEEIERLNNIIDELEKWLDSNSRYKELFECDRYYQEILNKLKELKGDK